MNNSSLPARYVFVGGLHRSGTSLLTRLIAAHPEVSALHAPDVPEGEGVYVQGAIPHTARHGVPGAFAFDPAQHMTETHPLNRLETRVRLERDWDPRFDAALPWRVEKSPVNMLRTRLYQQLFPLAHFVLIVRHPVVVAQATAKWSDASDEALIRHWDAAHTRLLEDLPYLHAALVMRYEDLVAEPRSSVARICRFLALEPSDDMAVPTIHDANRNYDTESSTLLPWAARVLGYRAKPSEGLRPLPETLACRHPLKDIQQGVLSLGRGGTPAAPRARHDTG